MSVIEREHVQVEVDPVRERRARVLEAAALEIEVSGWCQREEEDDAGRVCMVGAINRANRNAHNVRSTWNPQLSASILVSFNDESVRDSAEVTFVLRWRAAEIRDGR